MEILRQAFFARHSDGFSLLEFLLTVTLLGVLTVMAVGGMQQLNARMQMNTNINSLLHTIYEARSRALTSGSEVVICPSGNALRCDTGNAWQNGWLAFQTPVAGSRQPGADARRLARGERMPGLRVSANRQLFVMRPFGRRSTNGTWIFCDRQALTAPQAVVVSYTGKPRVTRSNPAGRPLRCPDI